MAIDEDAHARNRRALMGAFTEHAVVEHAAVLEDHVSLLVQRFRDRVDAGRGKAVVNMVDWVNYLTFDISGALSFGSSFDSVKNGKAHPWVEISCSFGKGLALMASVNFFAPLDRAFAYAIPETVRRKMTYHRELVHERFMQRLGMVGKQASQDYVGSVLKYNEEKGEVRVPIQELEANMAVLIFAGSETTATALVSTINALLRQPEELGKLVDEIRGAFGSVDEITVASVGKLEYLTAVLKEGIRLGPPAAVGLPRVVPNPGETICGRWVPGDTFVSLNQYPAYRSPSNFTHPSSFIPSRFLPSTPFPNDNTAVFEPFLVGRHKCLGQKLAWAEMRLLLAQMLWEFDIGGVEGEVYGDFGERRTYLFWEKGSLNVEVRPRNGSDACSSLSPDAIPPINA
ncbi:cytochrome P450 [Lentithecium fluviatile CBS 122367]|uniref:Cytochrome P450 n=1 Tax=Lentithecium fluviatile CBS 122367 TaxID=1168545 RepID=A0A6G1IMV4_9PLEO|nr:cytochrome P450 [Lentithecium fluviatile CBS 122367]